MFATLRNAWRIADIRKKILYTMLILIIFRVGSAIPVPFLDPSALSSLLSQGDGNLLGYINVLTGGSFSKATLFALSISPYITSSIVIQLLTIAIPALERLAKEGEEGRKKINRITRYAALALAFIESIAYFIMLRNMGAVESVEGGFASFLVAATIVCMLTAGAMLIVWLGERNDANGIGNAISMILFAGIISRGPAVATTLWGYIQRANLGETQFYFLVPAIVVLFVVIIGFIVLMTNAERRIPVQYAKRVVGRKMYGGQSTHIPVKVNMVGVMTIIFAGAILSIPGSI